MRACAGLHTSAPSFHFLFSSIFSFEIRNGRYQTQPAPAAAFIVLILIARRVASRNSRIPCLLAKPSEWHGQETTANDCERIAWSRISQHHLTTVHSFTRTTSALGSTQLLSWLLFLFFPRGCVESVCNTMHQSTAIVHTQAPEKVDTGKRKRHESDCILKQRATGTTLHFFTNYHPATTAPVQCNCH